MCRCVEMEWTWEMADKSGGVKTAEQRVMEFQRWSLDV
jgi:hypothetical protein